LDTGICYLSTPEEKIGPQLCSAEESHSHKSLSVSLGFLPPITNDEEGGDCLIHWNWNGGRTANIAWVASSRFFTGPQQSYRFHNRAASSLG
jgi:hypothetical protein